MAARPRNPGVDLDRSPRLKWDMALTRHCYKCGLEYALSAAPGRSETCDGCGADLKVCLNCVSYDPRAAYQCRDRRTELVADKDLANFCEWFDFARREWKGPSEGNPREAQARNALKKLLGD